MGGDHSAFTFDPTKNFINVLKKQGGLDLDSDQIERSHIYTNRIHTEALDTLGRCVVPSETPDGFRIDFNNGNLTIDPGRIYVDGILAENHGGQPFEFDPVLEREVGQGPIPYDAQPFLPNTESLPSNGHHLVYLDVWRREITSLEDQDILEKALDGIETTTREQVVWGVKLLRVKDRDITCATPDAEFPQWLDLTQPSGGRLSTSTVDVPLEDDPCLIPPSGGYRGLENLLYRVEVHDPGLVGIATFKFARHNASVAAQVLAIDGVNLRVSSLGRDGDLRFKDGDWVEVTDDFRELHGEPGFLRKVETVVDETDTVILELSLPNEFPISGPDHLTDPTRHTRIRRWDQRGQIRRIHDGEDDGFVDVDNTDGVIPIPPSDTQLVLGHGISVRFSTDTPDGEFKTGDYWNFTARVGDASVEILDEAPPRGIHHHYCRLAFVDFQDQEVEDCRKIWPPEGREDHCHCTVCVSAESHNTGTLTIQQAIAQVREEGGTVCLGAGIFNLGTTPIRLRRAQSVTIRGQGWKTILAFAGTSSAVSTSAISIEDVSVGVTLDNFSILTNVPTGGRDPGGRAIDIEKSVMTTISNIFVNQIRPEENLNRGGPAIGLGGVLIQTVLRDNIFLAATGIENIPRQGLRVGLGVGDRNSPLGIAGFYAENNLFYCANMGLTFSNRTVYAAETRIAGNFFYGCDRGGIRLLGTVVEGSPCNIQGNTLQADGDGIIIGIDDACIEKNSIVPLQANESSDGIVLVLNLQKTGIERCLIRNNRITNIGGHGIVIASRVDTVMIQHNLIDGVGGVGIGMDAGASAGNLSVEHNQLFNIAPEFNSLGESIFGMFLINCDQVNVIGNTIKGVGRGSLQGAHRAGLRMIACQGAKIEGNVVLEVGPPDEFISTSYGVEVIGPYDRLEIVNNFIRRDENPPESPGDAGWRALLIRTPRGGVERFDNIFAFTTSGNSPVGGAVPSNRFLRIFTEENRHSMATDVAIRSIPVGREIVAIRGNLCEAHGRLSTVDVRGNGSCVFNDNRCFLRSSPPHREPTVALQATTLVANANVVEGSQGSSRIDLQVEEQRVSVVGNIANGSIQLNSNDLPDPWRVLNVNTLS